LLIKRKALRRRFASAACVAFALALAPISASAADNVSISLAYTAWAANIMLYVGVAKGFYEKEGLNVEIKPNRGAAATMLVGNGQEQFAFIDSAAAVTARAKGIPIVALANLQQDNGSALFATERSGIQKVEDMRGKNVGAFTGSQTTIFLQALLNKHGMTMNDVNIVTVRSGTDLPLVQNGGIDAEVTIFNNELTAWPILYPDLKLKIWRLRDLGFDTPGAAIVTGEKLVNENPKLAKRFTDATLAALDFSVKNPEEAVKILVAAVPELKPELEAAKWKALMPTVTAPVTEKHGLGAIDAPRWEELKNLLLTYKVIENDIDLKPMLRDDLRATAQ
jgi:NitT/TauT family transport system substrate-binding protein